MIYRGRPPPYQRGGDGGYCNRLEEAIAPKFTWDGLLIAHCLLIFIHF